jgi:hypothetical protein
VAQVPARTPGPHTAHANRRLILHAAHYTYWKVDPLGNSARAGYTLTPCATSRPYPVGRPGVWLARKKNAYDHAWPLCMTVLVSR